MNINIECGWIFSGVCSCSAAKAWNTKMLIHFKFVWRCGGNTFQILFYLRFFLKYLLKKSFFLYCLFARESGSLICHFWNCHCHKKMKIFCFLNDKEKLCIDLIIFDIDVIGIGTEDGLFEEISEHTIKVSVSSLKCAL